MGREWLEDGWGTGLCVRVGEWVGGEGGWEGGGGGGCGDVEIGVVREVRAWWGGGVMWALWFLLLLDKTKGSMMY